MSVIIRLSIVLVLTNILSGCTLLFSKSKYLDEQETDKSVLVFGYLDTEDAPFVPKWGEIKQVRPTSDDPYKELRANSKGLFYLENLPAVGSYKLQNLGGPEKGFFSNTTWTWGFPAPNRYPEFKRLQFKTKTPGLYYMGAYKVLLVKKGGFFGVNKYETIVNKDVTEKMVLKQLVKYTDGTKWEKIVKKRIKRLKK